MKSPKISIVIPSYNKVKYIDQTLKSIFDQSYKNFEVIIQDGGSTDGTVEIIKKYVKKYPEKIKFESKKDKGQLDAINKGFKKANGDILTYINADDVYELSTLSKVATKYEDSPNSLWFAGKGSVINKKGYEIAKLVSWYKNFLLAFSSYRCLLIINYLIQPSIFITKKTYQKYGQFRGTKNFVMEYDLWLKVGKVQMPTIIKSRLSKFRIEENTKTKLMYSKLLKEDEKIMKKYTKNKLILLIHKLHNIFRVIAIKKLNV